MQKKPQRGVQAWYRNWFDTPFYHILYSNRDFQEAANFIRKLHEHLHLPKNSKVLDLACGKGRHAIQLNKLGYNVCGIDLSEKSIAEAQKHENQKLKFDVWDMRNVYPHDKFNAIFNLFTSFGYFSTDDDNIQVIRAAGEMLETNGLFILDYFNAPFTIKQIEKSTPEMISKGNIEFHVSKEVEGNDILKNISFESENERFFFQERVKAYDLNHFKIFFEQSGFSISKIFGSYKLDTFDEETSERLIIIAQKN